MDSVLLATKLRIPPEPHHAVRRARLIDALEGGIPDYKITLVSAPAGYGKTSLLAQWAHSSRFATAWLSIGREDNDIDRFLRYLFAAWAEVQPGIRESPVGLLLSGKLPDLEAVLAAFPNVAQDGPESMVLVLDDYHLIEDASIHQALTVLLDHLPPSIHFVLAGRAEPPLPLASYRARHALLEFHAEELQFRSEEAAEFFHGSMGLDLAQDEIVSVQTQLEGWITGLQLVALSRQRRLGAADKLVVSGRQRFIADFLSEDVLAPLAWEKRQFLLQTSILDRLCGSLCDVVTGKEGSQDMLESLERESLFLMPLDDSRQWFRYHRIFGDFLHEELKRHHSDAVTELHRRAARWYLDHDLPEPAFHHAVEGNDAELTIQIFDHYSTAKLMSGEVRVVGRWVESLPAAWYVAYPVLELARAGFLAFTGAYEASLRCLDDVEQRLTQGVSERTRWQLARVTAVRCMMACARNDVTQAETYARQALQDLPDEDLNWRPGIYGALGDTYRQNGRWDEARDCYRKGLAIIAPTFRFMASHPLGALADLALRQGRLRNAADYWRRALASTEESENWGRVSLPVVGWVYIRLAELLYEGNDLAQAWEHLSQGLERAELGGDQRAMIAGYLLAGRMKLTEGAVEAAAEYLERAHSIIETAPFPDWINRFERFQLELWLAQGRLRTAVAWADEMLQSNRLEGRPENEIAQLAVARVFIVKGDVPSIDQALALLQQLVESTEGQGRMGLLIEALALQALASWKRGERANALTALERALRLAEPEGYVRLFADLGLPMARLLQEARARAVMPDYLARLLAAFRGNPSASVPTEAALPEPLSSREQEILELIAAGLTNQEIAARLVISPETVKKHTGSIYGKLGVGSRTEAVARARTLDLLR